MGNFLVIALHLTDINSKIDKLCIPTKKEEKEIADWLKNIKKGKEINLEKKKRKEKTKYV